MHSTSCEVPLYRVTGISRTDIRIEWSSLQERDDVVDLALRAIHLPVTANEEFATHFSRSYIL